MNIHQFLDATYLKTATQAKISKEKNLEKVICLVKEALANNYKLVMVRANYISIVKTLLEKTNSKILIGTVIDFPDGKASLKEKLKEAENAIKLGADELDFVINYQEFKKGNISLITKEVTHCANVCLINSKVAKFIIEVSALENKEIIVISQLIKKIVLEKFGVENAKNVFIKSSTGYYKTEQNKPNGATLQIMKLISENAKPLKIKASSGIRDYGTALKMISLGVNRIGTSSPKTLTNKA